jgi:hypothetical protein
MTRKIILQTIFNNFQGMTQWLTSPDHYLENYNQAVALIELLEVEDCGSVGGYDPSNKVKWNESGFHEYDRFLALLRKKDTKLEKEIYFTPETMRKFWLEVSNLREKFNE